MMDPLSAH